MAAGAPIQVESVAVMPAAPAPEQAALERTVDSVAETLALIYQTPRNPVEASVALAEEAPAPAVEVASSNNDTAMEDDGAKVGTRVNE